MSRPAALLDIDFCSFFALVSAASNLGTSAFSTIPDPAALKFVSSPLPLFQNTLLIDDSLFFHSISFLVLIYHSSTLLGSIIQRCKADGPTADDDASCLATSRALLQVLNTNVELGSSAGRLPLGLLMVSLPRSCRKRWALIPISFLQYFKLAANIVAEGVSSGKASRDGELDSLPISIARMLK